MICVSILLMAVGCHSDTDVKVIDFSKTVVIERPGHQSQSDSTLRVAVASMISPKETVVHYHRLLDYIAAIAARD